MVVDVRQVPADLEKDAKFVQDAVASMENSTSDEKRKDWASIVMTRGAVFRSRSIKYNRLRSREPQAKNETEALVAVAGAIADLEDSMMVIVSSSCSSRLPSLLIL